MTTPPIDPITQMDIAKEKEIERLSEMLDGADLYTVLSIIADSEGEFLPECLQSSLYRELIHATQSDPEAAYEYLTQMAILDNSDPSDA